MRQSNLIPKHYHKYISYMHALYVVSETEDFILFNELFNELFSQKF